MAVEPRILLFLLVVCLAAYDWRRKRVPNWVTLPLIGAGFLLNYPGALGTWLGCLFLCVAWHFGALGGGDAKLWVALLWLTPRELAGAALPIMGGILMLTALAQVLWRTARRIQVFGIRSPGAWRAIPFALWLVVMGQSGLVF